MFNSQFKPEDEEFFRSLEEMCDSPDGDGRENKNYWWKNPEGGEIKNAELLKKAMLAAMSGRGGTDDDFDSFAFPGGDMPSDFWDRINKLNIRVETKHPEHIFADARVVGEKAKGEAQFAHFSQAINDLHSKLGKKGQRIEDIEKRSKKQASDDHERINRLTHDVMNSQNTIGHLRGKIRRANELLTNCNERLVAQTRLIENAVQKVKEVMLSSGRVVQDRLKTIMDALEPPAEKVPIATNEEETDRPNEV